MVVNTFSLWKYWPFAQFSVGIRVLIINIWSWGQLGAVMLALAFFLLPFLRTSILSRIVFSNLYLSAGIKQNCGLPMVEVSVVIDTVQWWEVSSVRWRGSRGDNSPTKGSHLWWRVLGDNNRAGLFQDIVIWLCGRCRTSKVVLLVPIHPAFNLLRLVTIAPFRAAQVFVFTPCVTGLHCVFTAHLLGL